MRINRLTITVVALFAFVRVNAQSNNNRLSWWPAFYMRYSINKRWTLNADVQARNFAKEPLIGLIALRTGAHYRFNNQWSAAIGSAWFHQQQFSTGKKKVIADELRLWEDIRHEFKLDKWKIINQFRTEQRYWTNQDGIAFRFRYRLATEYVFSDKWKAMGGNEIMWQSSKARDNWDQYRAWVGSEYTFNARQQVQLSLMNWWQFSNHTHQPVVRINFIQSINAPL